MTALVSAILPVHNRANWVARAVASVLGQSYAARELIIVDDGSTDGTPELLRTFASHARILRQEHSGAYAARNLALRRASGEFVAFIDSDDAWLPERLSRQMTLMQRPEVGLVFGDAAHVSGGAGATASLGLSSFRVTPPARGRVAAHFAWGNFVPTSAVLVRRSCLEETGGFSVREARSADYLQWFQIALRHELDYVPEPVVQYTVHAEGLSHDLEQSLCARIRLFADELSRTSDPSVRDVLRQLLFNLALHLSWAVMRGRAARGSDALRLAWRTAMDSAGGDAPAWTAAFARHHLQSRLQVRDTRWQTAGRTT